jgi:hypothetical protein
MEKIIHQIWVGPYEMPDMEKYFISKVKEKNPDYKHILWNNNNLPELPERVKEHMEYFTKEENYAFVADVLRIFLIREYGGIYMDVDWECHKGFGDLNLGEYNGLIVYHSEYTSGNEIFGCLSKSGFIEYMYNDMLNSNVGSVFMPYWFNSCLKKYYNIIDTWERNNFSVEEFEANGLEFLQLLKNEKVLGLKKWGEFENIYLSHRALFSWDNEHKKMFKEGNINYKDEYCFVLGYNNTSRFCRKNSPISKDEIGDKVKLLKVTYGDVDVKGIVQDYCIKNDIININVNNDTFTDTLPNVHKQMIIEFEYDGVLVKETLNENSTFKYPN